MPEHGSQATAPRSWRVQLLLVDGALILLFSWLLYVVVAERKERDAAATENGGAPGAAAEAVAEPADVDAAPDATGGG